MPIPLDKESRLGDARRIRGNSGQLNFNPVMQRILAWLNSPSE